MQLLRLSALLCAAFLFPVLLTAGETQPDAAGVQSTAQTPARDACIAADELARSFRSRSFFGSLDFTYVHERPNADPVRQSGTAYLGPNGAVRLDLWAPASADGPYVCAVANGHAWMVPPGSSLVHEADYPLQYEQSTAWPGMLKTLTEQARRTGDQLLFGTLALAPGSGPVLESAFVGDELRIEVMIRPPGQGGTQGVNVVHARYDASCDCYIPFRVECAGSTLELADHDRVADGLVLPRQVKLLSSGGECTRTWTISGVHPMDASESLSYFDAPDSVPSAAFPLVHGRIFYDADGAEHVGTFPVRAEHGSKQAR